MARADVSGSVVTYECITLFGRIASEECFGKIAKHATCQINSDLLAKKMFFSDREAREGITRDLFKDRVEKLAFQWPLKPFGVSEKRVKTTTMNKAAALRVWEEAAKRKNFRDPFFLNMSDRDRANIAISGDGVTDGAIDALFNVLSHGNPLPVRSSSLTTSSSSSSSSSSLSLSIVRPGDLARLSGMDYNEFYDLLNGLDSYKQSKQL
eukprot:CAMPEP_0170199568 /NCGR_PEP_ID=MMETSP0040_2-20121228/69409_1 /TAXON_ID=641309 /ORGANISM="Lotharella oceanica, Strain CCMP622" /LENGTH=208 /DNA_ID=CAMNT_0010449699 /DNA_START=163 /DNA_END=792 /DNA_ORIENTATION=+